MKTAPLAGPSRFSVLDDDYIIPDSVHAFSSNVHSLSTSIPPRQYRDEKPIKKNTSVATDSNVSKTHQKGASRSGRGTAEKGVLNSPLNYYASTFKPGVQSHECSVIFEVRKVKGRKETYVEADVNGQQTRALIDSGCTISAIDADYAKERGFALEPLTEAIPVRNADGSMNTGGTITHSVTVSLTIDDHTEDIRLLVTKLTTPIFLGHDWLQKHNPRVDWRKGELRFEDCNCALEAIERIGMIRVDKWLELREERIRGVAQDIAIEQNKLRGEKTFEDVVPEHYWDFRDVFEEKNFEALPPRRSCDHVIELLPNAKPYCGKAYRMTHEEEQALEEFLEENLKTGRIRPSKSPWGAPFFFIKKKDGKLRPVQDYRQLNAQTKKNAYPLPLIGELLDKLRTARYYTKLDIRWGYNNIRIAEGDEEKAAFMTTRGLFEPTVMFFGLCNAPATFQAFMNEGLKDQIAKGDTGAYLDDIIIFNSTLKEHRSSVREVLQRLREMGVTCKPSKCEFETSETEYVGHIVGHNSVAMDPAKVKGVVEWPPPRNKTELRAFLGFANFYRRFIEGFAHTATPLNKLTGKSTWEWTEQCEEAFISIKRKITSAPILIMPDRSKPFRVETDASQYATGGVLTQQIDGFWKPVAFISQSLNDAERRYAIYDRELLAIIRALKEWRHFLVGPHFEILTDHKNLEYFKSAQTLNARQARWYIYLQDFDYKLVYTPGKRMHVSDPLSRRADHITDTVEDKITMIPSQRIAYLGTEAINDLIQRHAGQIDPAVRRAALTGNKDYSIAEDGAILRRGCKVIPSIAHVIAEVIRAHHDTETAGHPGVKNTTERIQRSYWWPTINTDVERYVKGCQICQATKIDNTKRRAPLHPNPVPQESWEFVSVDMITGLEDDNDYNAIIVFVDMKTKDFISVPCRDTLTQEQYANIYRDHVYARHGLSKRIYSDRGPQFVSSFIKAVYKLLGIEGNPSTAYHPQTDGQTERINQEIKKYLRIFARNKGWSGLLPMAEFKYRTQVHSGSKFTPFMLNHGHEAYTGVETNHRKSSNVTAEEWLENMKTIQRQAEEALKQAKEAMKRQYDKKRQAAEEYKAGDKVWLDATNLPLEQGTRKLAPKRVGPFEVLEKVGEAAYKLKLPSKMARIHPVFNEVLLTRHVPPAFDNQKLKITLPKIVTVEVPKVQSILEARRENHGIQYLVIMEGSDNSKQWVKRADIIRHNKEIIEEFHKSHPDAPAPLLVP